MVKKLEINGGGKRGATVATNSIRRPRGGPTGMIKVILLDLITQFVISYCIIFILFYFFWV